MKQSAHFKKALLAAASGLIMAGISTPALAQGDFLLNMRLRSETVDQEGVANEANAVTLRTRFGFQSEEYSDFRFLIEGENITHLVDDFNDTVNGLAGYPVVADPESTELNRLQLTYTGFEDTTMILGRQRIIIGDSRYVGNVGFRQNEQTFDALLVQNTGIEDVTLTYAYVDRVFRIFGDDHPFGELDTQTHIARADVALDGSTLSGMMVLSDIPGLPAISTSTWVVNWSGAYQEGGGPRLGYMVEYAHQSDYADNPSDMDLGMFRAEASIAQNGLSGAIGVQSLQGDGTRGFITPLATLHKFQGWADMFLATPSDGIRDLYLRGGYRFDEPPFGTGMSAMVIYHNFETENGGNDLGSEIDAVFNVQLNEQVGLQAKAAFYDGPSSNDRDKIWFAITYSR
ncbi:MAG: hypothetical protein P8J78_07500 [Maricaulis sp.]|nr:hypothetical protein [Maricaulis sp.]MDG2044437.1 hypothetical protein [Maricaulis sp.]